MIESLDMNVLFEGAGRKIPEKPKLKTNTKKDFTLYEKPQAQKTAPERNNLESDFGTEFAKAFDYEVNKNNNYVPLKQNEKENKISVNNLPQTDRFSTRNDTFMKAYNSGQDYLMSEGNSTFESAIKGMINRARSAVGTGVEDFAYFLNDNFPGYKPAKNVLDNKTAGTISEKADSQFKDAKEGTGEIGDRLIDFVDNSSEMLGYSMFGPKAFTYAFGTREGFGEYRALREQGYSETDSFVGALERAGYAIATEKIDDYIGKNNPIDNMLHSKYGFVDNNYYNNYNRANRKGELVNDYHGALTNKEWSGYYHKLAQEGKLNSKVGDEYIYQTGGKIVLSQRVNITNDTNDYQVYDVFKITGGDSNKVAKSIANQLKQMGGNNYDGGRISSIFSQISGFDGKNALLTKYDRASGTYISCD